MSIEEEFDRDYKELPKQVRLGFALFIETYPGTYNESITLLEVLHRMQTRFYAWKKHRVADLGFQMRKHTREYKCNEHNGFLSLQDELELLQNNHTAMIQDKEDELDLLYAGVTMLMNTSFDQEEKAMRLTVLLKNINGPRTIPIRTRKYIKKDETIIEQIAKA
jgi:hypothetical protein